MKRNYKIDFTTNTLTITKGFEKELLDPTSDEYKLLLRLKADFKNLRVVKKAAPRRKKKPRAGLTYDKMVKFLSCQANSAILLNEFTEVREYSKAQSNPYQFVRDWFLLNFPHYDAIPKFDREGKMIAPSAQAETRKLVSLEETKEVA